MPKLEPSITVLMATYNCGKYLKQSIKSILNQTYRDFEFIIIDDGSTDNSEDIFKSFDDTRILFKKTENKGTSAALNLGIKLARGFWVARIDADDINTPNRLETQINFIKNNPEYDIISSWSIYFKDPYKFLFVLKSPIEHNDIVESLNLHNPLNQSSLLYKKEIILKYGYNENFKTNEDFELFYRIKDQVKFYNIPEFLVFTRIHKNSKTNLNENANVYDMLFQPAFKNLIESQSKGRAYFWASKIAWINYFYGNQKDARSYFLNSFSLKNAIAYLSTFLPDNYFHKLLEYRIKYRFTSLFLRTKTLRKQLKNLIN